MRPHSGVPMLSVDYRLAPEGPHPIPVEDCYAGLTYLADHAASLGVDPKRLAVMGESAGGGLATAIAMLARDRKGPALAKQILIYAMLDDRNTEPDPRRAPFASWTYDDNITAWRGRHRLCPQTEPGGIPVELHVHPGAQHGFELIAPDSKVAQRSTKDRLRVLQTL